MEKSELQSESINREFEMPTEIDKYLYTKYFSEISNYINKELKQNNIYIFNKIIDKGYLIMYSGGGGCIFKQIGESYIIKIIYNKKECENYAKLPIFEEMPYIDPRLTTCRVILKNEIYSMFDDKIIEYDILGDKTDEDELINNYFLLRTPYLGIDFLDYLWTFSYAHYNRIWVSRNEISGNNDMTVEIFKNLCNIMHIFNIKLHNMNLHNVVHKDIKPNNIIYDIEENKLILIDFDQSKVYNDTSPLPIKEIYNDVINYIKLVVKQVIYYAIRNKYIYDNIIKTRILFLIETFNTSNPDKLFNSSITPLHI